MHVKSDSADKSSVSSAVISLLQWNWAYGILKHVGVLVHAQSYLTLFPACIMLVIFGKPGNVRVKSCNGELFIANFTFGATPVFSRLFPAFKDSTAY